LGIYDVMLDIKTESNISPKDIVIPLLQNIIKFEVLFPIDSVPTRDSYCELRWKAIKFLEDKGLIKNFKTIRGTHRWDTRIRIYITYNKFEEILNKMHEEYKRRENIASKQSEQSDSKADVTKEEATIEAKDKKAVFVVHGRNEKARKALFSFLRSISLRPLEWSECVRFTEDPSPYIGEILDSAYSEAQAVIVLMTPDDEAKLREAFIKPDDPQYERELTGQARPNVLFEAGMAFGRFSKRTILVELGELRPFSDIGGRHIVKLNNSTQKRQELAQRLETAGCPVDLSGTDWHTEGNFEKALEYNAGEYSYSSLQKEKLLIASNVVDKKTAVDTF